LTLDLIANLLIGNPWSICFAPLEFFFQSQQFSNVCDEAGAFIFLQDVPGLPFDGDKPIGLH
jgi:hypothetical protein